MHASFFYYFCREKCSPTSIVPTKSDDKMAGRVRRTNAEIDNTVMTELEKLVIKRGFGNVLVTE